VTTIRTYRVRRCTSCRLVFSVPRPTVEELDAFYSGSYFNRPEDAALGYEDYGGESWAAANARRMWRAITVWHPPLLSANPRRLLDVGAATGDFAAAAADDGWEVYGVEIADYARAQGREKGVIMTKHLHDDAGPFGLVTMWHVLEHVVDPVNCLVDARSVATPGAYLVIELPNWHSFGRILKRDRWSQLRPPEHINFFTRASLQRTASRAGWRIERSATLYPHARNRAAELWHQRRPLRATRYAAPAAVLERLGLGGYLRVVARPI